MGKVVSHMTMSLDGFIADSHPPALCRTADCRPALLSLKVSTVDVQRQIRTVHPARRRCIKYGRPFALDDD